MLDAKLIAACVASRIAYERVVAHVTDKDLGPYSVFWWKQIREWYERDSSATAIDIQVLVEFGKRSIRNPKHEANLVGFIRDLPEAPSPENVSLAVLELKRHNVGLELAQAITGQSKDDIDRLLPEYEQLLAATDLDAGAEREDALDWHELHAEVDSEHRIPLAPGRLNERLRGGVWPGSHIVLFGRTDMGKTTMALNMAAGFLWSGQRLLYVGNEDSINALKYRMMGRLAGMTPEEIEANKKEAEAKAKERSEDRLLMTHLHRPTVRILEAVIRDFQPTALILDQIRGLQTKGEGMTQRLEEAGIEVRALTARYKLVTVSITQANDRTSKYGEEPPAELGLTDIDSSRTGLPGTADLILGLGGNTELLARGQRMLSLPKNKFSSARNAKQPLILDFDTARSKVK